MNKKYIEEEFNKIYDETYKKCMIYITCKCQNTNDISDILQEVYIELYKSLEKKGIGYIKDNQSYVNKIAKFKIYKYYNIINLLKNSISIFSKSYDEDEFNLLDLEKDEFENIVEKNVIYKDNLVDISNYLKTKKQCVQKAFYLFYYADMKIPEIAKELNEKESNIKNWIYRTTKEIREKFGKEY